MEKINDDAIKIIICSIHKMVEKKLNELSYDKQAYVLGTDTDGKVSVIIDKQEYKVKNGTGITFVEGNKCLVHYINGDSQKKVIIAKL